jgi:serine/threonine-protein kinase
MHLSEIPKRYHFTGEVLSGGQGDVYVCEDGQLGRLVAVKSMASPSAVVDILNEVTSLGAVRSKHVVQIYDILFASMGTVLAIVLEYVPGPDLTEYKAPDHPLSDTLRLLYQIACGISDLHACGKIHRDIKPNNMKLDPDKVLKIFDFGLCKDAGDAAITSKARGTQGYRAPELYAKLPVKYTTAVDVYAFGVLSWHLLVGEVPDVLLEFPPQSTGAAPAIGGAVSQFPPELGALFDACLSPDPAQRPAMTDVRDAVARRLLFGRHRAHLSSPDRSYLIAEMNQPTRIRAGDSSITIYYDGLRFIIAAVEGDVYINNHRAESGANLPDSCVITIGGQELGARRVFVAFDISHQEVVL